MTDTPQRVTDDLFRELQKHYIQHAYRQFPAVFDDIGKTAIRNHGEDVIKDEILPQPLAEHACFGAVDEPGTHGFSRTKSCWAQPADMQPALDFPPTKRVLRHDLHLKIQEVRRNLSTHLYREYLKRVLVRLGETPKPDDWLVFSSTVQSELIADMLGHDATELAVRQSTWIRVCRLSGIGSVKTQVDHLLMSTVKNEKRGQLTHRLDTGRQQGNRCRTDWYVRASRIRLGERTVHSRRRQRQCRGADSPEPCRIGRIPWQKS